MLDLRPHRDRMVQAIMDRHWQRALEAFPDGIAAAPEQARTFSDSYRPYAEADVDSIIEALASNSSSMIRTEEKP